MKIGGIRVGTDLVEISRIEKSLKNPRFLTRVFSEEEQKLLQGKHLSGRAAANFAGKEAFSKSLGTGVRGFSLREVAVLRDHLGAPYLQFSGRAAEMVREQKLQFSVSLTHTEHYASAVVIAYTPAEERD